MQLLPSRSSAFWIEATSLQLSLFDTTLTEYDSFDDGGFNLFERDEYFRQPLRTFFADGPRNIRYLLSQLRFLEKKYYIMFLENHNIDWTVSFAISDWTGSSECRKFCIDDLASWRTDFSRTTIGINTDTKSIYYRLSRLSASSNISSYTSESTICAIDSIVAKKQPIHHASDWCSNSSNISIYVLRFPICAANFNITENEKSSYQLR